jgi:O-antigen ligase
MDFLSLIAAAGALIWGALLLCRGGLLAGTLVVLLAGICFGQPFFTLPFGPVPLTADRALFGILLGLTLCYRQWGWTNPKPATSADWCLCAFVLVFALSTLTHDWSAHKWLPMAQLLFAYLMPLVMYWIVRQAAVSERAIWGLLLVVAVFGLYLAVTAIAETHQLWALVFPKYIASPATVEFFGRGRGPLLNPAGSGILQGLCMMSALMRWPRLSRRGKLLLLLAMPLYAWGIYSTLTRSAWMGMGLGLLVVVGLTLPRSWRMPVIGFLVLAAVPLVALNFDSVLAFKRDKRLSAEEAAESARLRPILAVVAWQMFLDRPLFGCGAGQYFLECRPYLSDRSIDMPLEKVRPYVQHNVFLSLLTETGLVGMGLFLATLLLWIRQAWRLWRSGVAPPAFRQCGLLFLAFVGVWFPNAMFQDVLLVMMVNMLLLYMAGLMMNLSLNSAAGALPVELPAAGRSWSLATPGLGNCG